MNSLTAEELLTFQQSTARLLADRSTEVDVRRTMEMPSGYDADLWKAMADLGVVGLIIDPAHGGSGAGPVEVEVVFEEAGAALLCSPLLSSGVLAAGLLQALGDEDANLRLLPAIADGSRIATAALTGPRGTWTPEAVAVWAHADGDACRLDGQASFVTHAHVADVLLVAANAPDGLAIFEVAARAAGVTVAPLPTFDHTLRIAEVAFAGAPARRISTSRLAWDAVEEALNLARVA